MVHSNQSLFTEQKWYLVSPAANGQWADVVAGWAAAGATAASSATFYKFIYKLHEPVTNGVSLSQNSWDQIDITGTHDDLEENVGYFVYVETAGTEATANQTYGIRLGTPMSVNPNNRNGNGGSETVIPVEAKWPVGGELTGGVIGTDELINFDSQLQSFYDTVSYGTKGPYLFNGATAGSNSVAQGVAQNDAIIGTGDWQTILVLVDGSYTFDKSVCNLAVDGVTYNEANAPGIVQ